MAIFYLRSDGVYVKTEGMTEATITAMLAGQGLTCTFIDEETYTANVPEVDNGDPD